MPLWCIQGKFNLTFYFKRMFGQCMDIGLNHFPNCYWFPFIFMYFGTLGTGGVAVDLLRVLNLKPLLRLEITWFVCTLFTEILHRLLKIIEELCELYTDVTGQCYGVVFFSLKLSKSFGFSRTDWNRNRNAACRIQYPPLFYTFFFLHLLQKLVKSRYTASESLRLSQNLEMISRARSKNWKLFFSITFIPVDTPAKYTFYLENP